MYTYVSVCIYHHFINNRSNQCCVVFLCTYIHSHYYLNFIFLSIPSLIGRKTGDSKDLNWMDYFDVIITGACKPAFLKDESSLSLFRVNPGK